MALQQVIDVTQRVIDTNAIEIGGWDYVVLQIIGASSGFAFKASNDSGGIDGVIDGNENTAINFTPISVLDLSDYTYKLNVSVDCMVKIAGVGKYFKVSEGNCEKALLQYYKI